MFAVEVTEHISARLLLCYWSHPGSLIGRFDQEVLHQLMGDLTNRRAGGHFLQFQQATFKHLGVFMDETKWSLQLKIVFIIND